LSERAVTVQARSIGCIRSTAAATATVIMILRTGQQARRRVRDGRPPLFEQRVGRHDRVADRLRRELPGPETAVLWWLSALRAHTKMP
jgi:hypothetical protein